MSMISQINVSVRFDVCPIGEHKAFENVYIMTFLIIGGCVKSY